VAAVFHQGACSDTMQHDGRLMLQNNYRCSRDLLQACQQQGVRLIYASSAAIYGSSSTFSRTAAVRAAAQCLRLFQAAVR
jgi:ADP-L-glycero-D-manno-heptose 6-epimerase